MKSNRINVLLIEDDPDYVYLMSIHLSEVCGNAWKFKMECADRLAAGLELLAREEFDVILLDLMLPDSQGLETLDRLKARAQNTPIVVLTNVNDEQLAIDAVAKGAQDYMVKGPLNASQLRRAIRYAIERGRVLASVENIIENSADGMVIVDGEGVVRYLNAAAEGIFGRARDEMVGQLFGYPVSPGETSTLTIPTPAGEERIAEMRVTEIEWKSYHASLASIRDITELRRLERLKAEIKERRRIDQMKDQLMSTVSHELRSPLTIIKAAVGNMHDGLTGPLNEAQTSMVELAHKNIKRLAKIINNLLDLSRLESGKARIAKTPVDIGRMIEDAAQGLRLAEKERNLTFEVQVAAELPPVLGDPDLIAQLLMNLLDNAVRYAKKTITVRALVAEPAAAAAGRGGREKHAAEHGERAGVHVVIIDDGPGIEPGRISDLFDKFVQVNRPAGGGGYKGTGLGLAICKEIIQRHLGQIWVESQSGKGAQFHFILPAAPGR